MWLTNREGLAEYRIPADWAANRQRGISAMLRLRDEEEFIEPCVRSIAPWCDEILCALQCSSDGTKAILERLSAEMPTIRIVEYPFDCHPNGPGHDDHPANSVYDRSYFYNWCLAQTRYSHVSKWDGDMVAFEWLGDAMRRGIHCQSVRIFGVDIVGPGYQVGERRHCATEPRLFEVTPATYYVQGPVCELARGVPVGAEIRDPAFLHFKWAKPFKKASTAWPDDWQDIKHFQEIAKRSRPVAPYEGDIPSVLTRS